MDQLIQARIDGVEVDRPLHDVKVKVSVPAIVEEVFGICNGSAGREFDRAFGTAHVIFERRWADAYAGYQPRNSSKEEYTPPPMKR